MAYLENDGAELKVEDIRGIWVASEEREVVERIKKLTPKYFPNVDSGAILWASRGVEGGPKLRGKVTHTDDAVSRTRMRVEVESAHSIIMQNRKLAGSSRFLSRHSVYKFSCIRE